MPRALYLADAAGIDATGLTADLHSWGAQGRKSEVREVLSRVKAVVDVSLDTPALAGSEDPDRDHRRSRKLGAGTAERHAARRGTRPELRVDFVRLCHTKATLGSLTNRSARASSRRSAGTPPSGGPSRRCRGRREPVWALRSAPSASQVVDEAFVVDAEGVLVAVVVPDPHPGEGVGVAADHADDVVAFEVGGVVEGARRGFAAVEPERGGVAADGAEPVAGAAAPGRRRRSRPSRCRRSRPAAGRCRSA